MTKEIRKLEIRTSQSSQELLRFIRHLDFGIPSAFVIRASSLSNAAHTGGFQARPLPLPGSRS